MEKVRLTVTIPKNIYDALYEQAERDMRTVSNQLTYILEQRLINPTPVYHTPAEFIKPTLAENPEGSPTITAQYKRKEIL